ncbi:MAG: hypothetical protein EPN25_15390 [Nitrospirae bacterium]|nr:MAG: hypothetical protein EPN25_15390 [Nitrospirota bacterium]
MKNRRTKYIAKSENANLKFYGIAVVVFIVAVVVGYFAFTMLNMAKETSKNVNDKLDTISESAPRVADSVAGLANNVNGSVDGFKNFTRPADRVAEKINKGMDKADALIGDLPKLPPLPSSTVAPTPVPTPVPTPSPAPVVVIEVPILPVPTPTEIAIKIPLPPKPKFP